MIDSKDADSMIVDVGKGSLRDFLLGFEDDAVYNSETDGEQDFGEVGLVLFGFDLDVFLGILWGARLLVEAIVTCWQPGAFASSPVFGQPQSWKECGLDSFHVRG